MNPFQVEWEEIAENELARIWLNASDPQAVTAAQAQADQYLSRDPASLAATFPRVFSASTRLP